MITLVSPTQKCYTGDSGQLEVVAGGLISEAAEESSGGAGVVSLLGTADPGADSNGTEVRDAQYMLPVAHKLH